LHQLVPASPYVKLSYSRIWTQESRFGAESSSTSA